MVLTCIKMAFAAACTAVTFLFGQWDTALVALLVFMAVDFLTGIFKGIKTKTLSSDIGFRGITKKLCILFILIIAVILDRLLNDGEWLIRTAVCYFYIANEAISILENAAFLGVPIPKQITGILAQLKGKEDNV